MRPSRSLVATGYGKVSGSYCYGVSFDVQRTVGSIPCTQPLGESNGTGRCSLNHINLTDKIELTQAIQIAEALAYLHEKGIVSQVLFVDSIFLLKLLRVSSDTWRYEGSESPVYVPFSQGWIHHLLGKHPRV